MIVEKTPNGYVILADWLDEPIEAPTWEQAYELAFAAKFNRASSDP